MEFVDLAEKSGEMVGGKEPTNKWYPSIRLTEKQLPMLKDKKIDAQITLVIDANIKGIHKYGNGDIEYDVELKQAIIAEDEPEEVKKDLEDANA